MKFHAARPKIGKAAKVEILNVSQHKFKPQGFTLVALLAESHMSFHTFPEKNIINSLTDTLDFLVMSFAVN